MFEAKKTTKQLIGFMMVGALGIVVNGFFYSFFSQFEIGRIVVLDFWFFSEINVAWGLGVLIAFISNFVLDKWLVFQA